MLAHQGSFFFFFFALLLFWVPKFHMPKLVYRLPNQPKIPPEQSWSQKSLSDKRTGDTKNTF